MEGPACPWDGPYVDPGDRVGVCCCVLSGFAQLDTMGLVLNGDFMAVSRDWGLGLVSLDSHVDTKHLRRDTNVLMVLIKYRSAHTAVSEIPVIVRNRTNHICFSCSRS